MRSAIAVCAFVLSFLLPLVAHADVQRFALLVGNNVGNGSDERLRFAESDATKVDAVLRELGGFPPGNVTVLRGESADTFRKTLIAFNDRVRSASQLPDTQTLLFVYYSGHADGSALHMGGTSLGTTELGQLVRGSSATFRLLVVDACRSGALTRVKGGTPVSGFALPPDPALKGEGIAFLTASSANEDAQESDEIQGSFFTHALVSGLLGAADRDGDGNVVLEEAYQHAYASTLRATSRSSAGAQHPTFRYDFRGQDALVLTRLALGADVRATLRFPAGVTFLVLKNDAEGAVVGEVGARDASRGLSLRPGHYFVRGRGTDALYEGKVALVAGESRAVELRELGKVQYARLVRKGDRESEVAHGPELGVAVRSQLPNATTPCAGVAAGYRLEFRSLSFAARVAACQASFENAMLSATAREFEASLTAQHLWDFSIFSAGVGLGGGAALHAQSFESRGDAPDRSAVVPFVLVVASFTADVYDRIYAGVDVRAETHFMNVQETSVSSIEASPAFAVRGTLMSGLHF